MATVTIKNVTKAFGDNVVLKAFDAEFQDGEFITLLGPSGCGKTTMLRMIAGFEKPTSGEIYIGGQLVSGGKTFVPPEKRGVGMVFQSYAVWPHMNVFDNVAYPLTIRHTPKAEIKSAVERVLAVVHLSQYAERFPNQLSGGQQQRTAIGRAIIKNPDILLCDEPTGALDYKTSKEILKLIETVNQTYGNTVVMVTHNDAIKNMADRVIRLRDGQVRDNKINTAKVPAEELEW